VAAKVWPSNVQNIFTSRSTQYTWHTANTHTFKTHTHIRCLIYRLGTNYCLYSFCALTCCVCVRNSTFKLVRLAPSPTRRNLTCSSERQRRVMYVANRKAVTSRHAEGWPLPQRCNMWRWSQIVPRHSLLSKCYVVSRHAPKCKLNFIYASKQWMAFRS